MTEFWESSFRDKKEMWGWEPADSAIRYGQGKEINKDPFETWRE